MQAATGIALAESSDGGQTPGALPVQALDHSGGHLLAAAVTTGLKQQRSSGGSIHVATSLARIAQELLSAGVATPAIGSTDSTPLPTVTERVDLPAHGGPIEVTSAPPALAFAGAAPRYAHVGLGWGADAAAWSATEE